MVLKGRQCLLLWKRGKGGGHGQVVRRGPSGVAAASMAALHFGCTWEIHAYPVCKISGIYWTHFQFKYSIFTAFMRHNHLSEWKIPRYSQNSFLNIYLVLSMSHWLRPWEHGHIKDARSSVQWKPQRQSSGKGQVWGNWPPVPLEGSSSTPREALWEEHGPDFHVNSRISAFAEMAVFHQSRILLQCDPDYSKSLTHKQIPFQEHVHKFNLFLCPVKLA